eukprot:scaffold1708_cov51-Phaeocystis_antarctica.AAC.2
MAKIHLLSCPTYSLGGRLQGQPRQGARANPNPNLGVLPSVIYRVTATTTTTTRGLVNLSQVTLASWAGQPLPGGLVNPSQVTLASWAGQP